jgi:hypothetical protein
MKMEVIKAITHKWVHFPSNFAGLTSVRAELYVHETIHVTQTEKVYSYSSKSTSNNNTHQQ